MNDERLKGAGGGLYFDELLQNKMHWAAQERCGRRQELPGR